MERELCLILDLEGKIKLTLFEGSKYEVDEYTSKKFDSSEEIRKKYKKKINDFLNENSEFLSNCKNEDYRGRIVIIDNFESEKKLKRVLYKKHIIAFKNIINDRKIISAFSDYEKSKGNDSYVANYFYYVVGQQSFRSNFVSSYIKSWITKEKKQGRNYYEIIRDMLYIYDTLAETLNMPTINEMYNEYKIERAIKRVSKLGNIKIERDAHYEAVSEITVNEEKVYNINGNRYNADELHMFDLEELEEILKNGQSDYIPDVFGKEKK